MGSPFKSIYHTSYLQSIYQTPVLYIQSPVAFRMTPVLVLLLAVLSLSHGHTIQSDPIGDPVNDPMDDSVEDPVNDPMDDLMDDLMDDPEDDATDDFPDIEELEMQAFEQCESDGEEGLTWDEVEECEEIFGPMLTDQGIVLPTEEDFQASDLNKDGILLYKEWKEWLDMDMDLDVVEDVVIL